MEAVKDASHLFEVERRAWYAKRPGFRISEFQISPTQQVPWHYHNHSQDTFYLLEGQLRLFLRDHRRRYRSGPAKRTRSHRGRHLVTNGGNSSATFFILQGMGEYDYVPLT
jgi:uncharacterized cupin superfamily protein